MLDLLGATHARKHAEARAAAARLQASLDRVQSLGSQAAGMQEELTSFQSQLEAKLQVLQRTSHPPALS